MAAPPHHHGQQAKGVGPGRRKSVNHGHGIKNHWAGHDSNEGVGRYRTLRNSGDGSDKDEARYLQDGEIDDQIKIGRHAYGLIPKLHAEAEED